ncbi:hypothetical protein AURDEDRAFT_128149 [Auricularia subglabra TFB-10046 SS5]|nr:hypothetical protein AURDEDRAFT_128149 [Auricularia subglabra TFB-10046 SS5]
MSFSENVGVDNEKRPLLGELNPTPAGAVRVSGGFWKSFVKKFPFDSARSRTLSDEVREERMYRNIQAVLSGEEPDWKTVLPSGKDGIWQFVWTFREQGPVRTETTWSLIRKPKLSDSWRKSLGGVTELGIPPILATNIIDQGIELPVLVKLLLFTQIPDLSQLSERARSEGRPTLRAPALQEMNLMLAGERGKPVDVFNADIFSCWSTLGSVPLRAVVDCLLGRDRNALERLHIEGGDRISLLDSLAVNLLANTEPPVWAQGIKAVTEATVKRHGLPDLSWAVHIDSQRILRRLAKKVTFIFMDGTTGELEEGTQLVSICNRRYLGENVESNLLNGGRLSGVGSHKGVRVYVVP